MKIRHVYIGGCVALVLIVSVLFTFQPVATPKGQQPDPPQPAAQQSLGAASWESALDERSVYFPEQFANQAKEPTELAATN